MIIFILFLFLFEVLSFVTCYILRKKYEEAYFKFFLFILFITVLTEFLGILVMLGEISFHFNIYYYYSFVLFNSVFLLFFNLVKENLGLLLMIFFNAIFNVFWLSIPIVDVSDNYVYIFGSINTSLFSFFYLRELLLSENIINYKSLLPFWITIAFLIFYLSSIPFFLFLSYIDSRSLNYIVNVLAVIMYLIIIYGVVTCKKNTNSI